MIEKKTCNVCISTRRTFKKYKTTPTLVYEGLVPSGVNLVLANDKEQDQTIYITDNIELAFNINTINDLNLSEHYINRK